jgi:hypothetical protein
LSSNEGNNMKGARQRMPVRAERNFRRTLLASALYAALSMHHAHAQPSAARSSAARENGATLLPGHFDGRIIRAQQRGGRSASAQDRDPRTAMQPVQQVDQTPPARPPRHTVMTADERRLLRQHIEEAVRDLYKR